MATPTHRQSPRPAALSTEGVTKRFPGVVANDNVSVELHAGQVHTLLGENGAGKSTLAAMLCGLYQPDEGRVLRDGEPIYLANPRDGLDRGIGMVHQHFRLVDRFTVAENVVLGDPRQSLKLDRRAIADEVAAVADAFGLPLDPHAVVGDLTVGQRQRVEIVRVLHRGADVLLLDEPTAVLTPAEVESLFVTVRRMTTAGKAVVFISHKLGEVMEISDRVTVMRHGRVTGTARTAEVDRAELARLMVGRSVDLSPVRAGGPPGEPRIVVRDLTVRDGDRTVVDGVSIDVHEREIVGVAGVAGNGQRELADAIAGLVAPSSGTVEIDGEQVGGTGPRRARSAGLAYVPEDRLGTGLAPSLSIADNLLLTRRLPWLVDRRAAVDEAERMIDEYDIKCPSAVAPTRLLSGGNAQKVLLARELADDNGESPVLVVASPTRGLDVGAIETVRARLADYRESGAAVLLISEDLDEVMSLCDRLLVLYRGTIAMETPADEADLTAIGMAMAGVADSGMVAP